ncbi:DUF4232 domain-containing protein [Streptomyces sp. NPDC057428]|uniref:DUF4232 domain-containing protein n=1 Tax=Streptomyces sp. NPDC057428 TaxID=3346129 RepID=UPI00367D06A1
MASLPASAAPGATDGPGSGSAPSPGAATGRGGKSDAPGPGTSGSDASRRCVAANLAPALVSNGQEMNSEYFDLRLRNKGSGACVLQGYPGVSLADAQGRRIGEPAARGSDGGAAGRSVTLKPGQSAHAVVKTAGEGISEGDCWAAAASVIVYPPGSKESVATDGLDGLRVCGDVFTVGPVTDTAPLAGG